MSRGYIGQCPSGMLPFSQQMSSAIGSIGSAISQTSRDAFYSAPNSCYPMQPVTIQAQAPGYNFPLGLNGPNDSPYLAAERQSEIGRRWFTTNW